MAMFGNRGPLSDDTPPYYTPPYFPQPQSEPDNPSPTAKPKFFGEGGAGRNIAGYIGDALLQMSGANPIYQPTMLQRQQEALLARQRQQQVQDQRDTWIAQQQYKAEHPEPVNNDTVNDFQFIAKNLGPEAATQYLRNIAAGQPIIVRNPDGTVTPVSRAEFSNPAPQGPPSGVTFTPLPPKGGDPSSRGGAGLTTPRPFR